MGEPSLSTMSAELFSSRHTPTRSQVHVARDLYFQVVFLHNALAGSRLTGPMASERANSSAVMSASMS